MISLDKLRSLIQDENNCLSDVDLEKIRTLLYYLARLAVENRLNQQLDGVQV